jgi:hypothetical protein
MKKLLAVFLLLIAGTASAQHFHHHHGYWQRGYNGGWNWVAPTIIGGVIGYEIARNQTPVVVQQQPVIVQQPATVIQSQNCSPWTETQNPDGTITRTRTCAQ